MYKLVNFLIQVACIQDPNDAPANSPLSTQSVIQVAARKSPHHSSHETNPHSKDSPIKYNALRTVTVSSSSVENGNHSFNVAGEVGAGRNTNDNDRERKPVISKSDSLIHQIMFSVSDPLLSASELNRIRTYCTVDIDTDFIANFNYIQ